MVAPGVVISGSIGSLVAVTRSDRAVVGGRSVSSGTNRAFAVTKHYSQHFLSYRFSPASGKPHSFVPLASAYCISIYRSVVGSVSWLYSIPSRQAIDPQRASWPNSSCDLGNGVSSTILLDHLEPFSLCSDVDPPTHNHRDYTNGIGGSEARVAYVERLERPGAGVDTLWGFAIMGYIPFG